MSEITNRLESDEGRGRDRQIQDTLGHKESKYIHRMATTPTMRYKTWFLTKLAQKALILSDYKYNPIVRIGENASIRPHSTIPHNGHISKSSARFQV